VTPRKNLFSPVAGKCPRSENENFAIIYNSFMGDRFWLCIRNSHSNSLAKMGSSLPLGNIAKSKEFAGPFSVLFSDLRAR